MRYIKADIVSAEKDFPDREIYIVQQANCVTLKGKGLSEYLETVFPGSCPYNRRSPEVIKMLKKVDGVDTVIELKNNRATSETRSVLGTVDFYKVPGRKTHIVSLFAQYNPGKPTQFRRNTEPEDTYETRLEHFRTCLTQLGEILRSKLTKNPLIAFPYKIGCGLAGGNWNEYRVELEKFAKEFDVVVYQKF